jgi:hypothetical protein
MKTPKKHYKQIKTKLIYDLKIAKKVKNLKTTQNNKTSQALIDFFQ